MLITVLTPDREVFKGNITSVKVPGSKGQFEVLKNHAPIVSSLDKGEVRIITMDGARITFKVNSGFIEVIKNEVSLLVQGVTELK
jgi:F-type H+-transporting ATPase subunit epsilon